jgi:co-chaperonin GroES (HSP10)
MKPIGPYILVTEIKEEIKTDSGLLLSILSSNDAKELRYKKAQVNAVGTDVSNVLADDLVYYDSRAGYTMIIDEKQYTVISLRDIVVVL